MGVRLSDLDARQIQVLLFHVDKLPLTVVRTLTWWAAGGDLAYKNPDLFIAAIENVAKSTSLRQPES